MIQLKTKKIINNLFEVKAFYENFEGSAIADSEKLAIQKALERLKREVDFFSEKLIGFEIIENNVLKIFKMRIKELGNLAEHYYLSETEGLDNSLGWGTTGLEVRGIVKITSQQKQRIQVFSQTNRYDIATNNCEHFANWVLHGVNLSSQQQTTVKNLGSKVIRHLQITQTVSENFCQEISKVLNHNLMTVKIKNFYQEYQEVYQQYELSKNS